MRWTTWTWMPRRNRSSEQCPYCENKLVPCPSCQGSWRTGCHQCGAGVVCPEHRAFWLV